MNDTVRDLLEQAAKAAGVELTFDTDGRWGEPWTVVNNVVCAYWNPLDNDGDALRLAVKLNMDLSISAIGASVGCQDVTGADIGNAYAATRHAIVRAAAEIGKAMI